jgi:hypothetical protein
MSATQHETILEKCLGDVIAIETWAEANVQQLGGGKPEVEISPPANARTGLREVGV